jgi:hypothetical protein
MAEKCIKDAVKRLQGSSLMQLVQSHDSQTAKNSPMPAFEAAMKIEPKTSNKKVLIRALREAEEVIEVQRCRNLEIQAVSILNATYCKSLAEKLAVQENAKKRLKKRRLMSDGLPVLLTGDFFYKRLWSLRRNLKERSGKRKSMQQLERQKWMVQLQ